MESKGIETRQTNPSLFAAPLNVIGSRCSFAGSHAFPEIDGICENELHSSRLSKDIIAYYSLCL